jgi:hypothetical protein
LLKPLRITVGPGILAHDVLNGFDDVRDVRHGDIYPGGRGPPAKVIY